MGLINLFKGFGPNPVLVNGAVKTFKRSQEFSQSNFLRDPPRAFGPMPFASLCSAPENGPVFCFLSTGSLNGVRDTRQNLGFAGFSDSTTSYSVVRCWREELGLLALPVPSVLFLSKPRGLNSVHASGPQLGSLTQATRLKARGHAVEEKGPWLSPSIFS